MNTTVPNPEAVKQTELLEISPLVYKLGEETRTKTQDSTLAFWRRIIRRGLLGEFGSENGTYGLIGERNRVFLSAAKLARTPEQMQSVQKMLSDSVTDLIALKQEIETL